MKRREVLQTIAAAVLSGGLCNASSAAAPSARRKLLFFSRSVLFEHPVVARKGGELSFAEKAFLAMAAEVNCDVECTKDGDVFDRDLAPYAAVVSYSCGRPTDLMKPESKDGSRPLTERGWQNLDRAVRAGKPMVAIHPGLWLLPEAFGADCLGHGTQQVGKTIVTAPKFPGAEHLGKSFTMMEEWFSLVRFSKELHVILVQDCEGMDKSRPADRRCYNRAPFPATWARMHGKGRAFYTSMGHREDVWTNPLFRQVLLGGLRWALGDVSADLTANIDQVTPHANDPIK